MKLYNQSGNGLSHAIIKDQKTKFYFLAHGEVGDVPKEIAELWLKINGVTEYVAPEDLETAKKEAEEKAQAEKQALEDKNAELEKEIAKLKKDLEAVKKAKNK